MFGDSVNVAARLVGVAQAAQVITSAATAAALSPWLRARTRELAALTLKGKLHDVSVFEFVWQDSTDDLTTLSTRVRTPAAHLRCATAIANRARASSGAASRSAATRRTTS